MPITVEQDGVVWGLQEYLIKSDKTFRKPRPPKSVSADEAVNELLIEKLKKAKNDFEAYRNERKKFTEFRRKSRAHGVALSDNEIRVCEKGFAVNEDIGDIFGLIIEDGDSIELKFSNRRKDLSGLRSGPKCEYVGARTNRWGNYYYRTERLYAGFYEGIYGITILDSGFIRIDEKYRPNNMQMRQFI